MLYAKQNTIAGFHLYADHILSFLESTPEAQQLLERFGYTVQRLQEGRALLEQAKATYRLVQALREQQKQSTQNMHEQWKLLRWRYQVQLQVARRVLGEEPVNFPKRSARGYSRWVSDAQDFYAAMLRNPAYLEKLTLSSITPEEMTRSAQLIQELMDHKNNQTQSRRNLRDGNQDRQQHQEAAMIWFHELLRVAPLAFRQQPGIRAALEALAPRPVDLLKKIKAKKSSKTTAEAKEEGMVVTPESVL